MPFPWPAVIAGGTSLISSLIGRGSVKQTNRQRQRLAQMSNKARMELADHAFKKDVEMWKMQRDYNKPQAQMERLEAAGINPTLVFGSGTVTGNMAGTPPSYQTPGVETPQVGVPPPPDLGGAVNSFLGAQMQVKKLEAQDYINLQEDWLAQTRQSEALLKDWEVEKTSLLRGKAIQNPEQTAQALWSNFIGSLSASEKSNLATDLKNQYQKQLNKWIEKGMTPGDSWKLRIGLMMLENLGVDIMQFDSELQKLLPNE